jgi:hypothetical protein
MKPALLTLIVLALWACGYEPVHTARGDERLSVALASSMVPDAAVTDELLVGLREELAKNGALATSADSYPRCEVEVLRADEASEGIAANADQPTARAMRVGIVARAWIIRAKGGPHERDTGDVRTTETVSVATDARTATFRHSDALKAAGRRAGKRLASRLMGLPAASDD